MTTLYKYRIKCNTDNTYEYWFLEEGLATPTNCPINTAHSVDLSSVTVVDIIEKNIVKIQEESTPTGENFRYAQTLVPGGTGAQPTISEYTWTKPISAFDIHISPTEKCYGDRVDMSVLSPDMGLGHGGIGFLSSPVNPGATGITVTQTVIDNTMIGFDLCLIAGPTVNVLGEVVEIDKVNNHILVQKAVGNTFLANSIVKQEIFISDQNYNTIGPAQRFPIGEGKIGGTYIPKGAKVLVKYYNENEYSNEEKKLYAMINYVY